VTLLRDACPSCGGGFVPRPIRPAHEWRTGAFLGHRPAGERRVFKPVDLAAHDFFAARLRELSPERR
jgi:hypothetical protein